MHFKLIFPDGHAIFVEHDENESVQALSDVIQRHKLRLGYLLNCGGECLAPAITFREARECWERKGGGDSPPEISVFRSFSEYHAYTSSFIGSDQRSVVRFSQRNVFAQASESDQAPHPGPRPGTF